MGIGGVGGVGSRGEWGIGGVEVGRDRGRRRSWG